MKRRILSLAVIFSVLSLGWAIWAYERRETPWEKVQDAALEKKLVDLARDFIRTQRPQWKGELELHAIALKNRTGYVVTYELPKDAIGGTAVVEFDRQFSVTSAHHLQ
jgi:hypothetical protein